MQLVREIYCNLEFCKVAVLNLVKRFLTQMVPMTITKEHWALILMTLRLDSAGLGMVGSSSE